MCTITSFRAVLSGAPPCAPGFEGSSHGRSLFGILAVATSSAAEQAGYKAPLETATGILSKCGCSCNSPHTHPAGPHCPIETRKGWKKDLEQKDSIRSILLRQEKTKTSRRPPRRRNTERQACCTSMRNGGGPMLRASCSEPSDDNETYPGGLVSMAWYDAAV